MAKCVSDKRDVCNGTEKAEHVMKCIILPYSPVQSTHLLELTLLIYNYKLSHYISRDRRGLSQSQCSLL